MNSFKFIRKCVCGSLIPRNLVKFNNNRQFTNFIRMENVNKDLGNGPNRVVTRSLSKKLNEQIVNHSPESAMPFIVGHDKEGNMFYIKMTDGRPGL